MDTFLFGLSCGIGLAVAVSLMFDLGNWMN
jgi:hypothetical protein